MSDFKATEKERLYLRSKIDGDACAEDDLATLDTLRTCREKGYIRWKSLDGISTATVEDLGREAVGR